ncbi:CPBP family intramembrane glutamic endopeptidase [Flavihumibacter petaseus]|uniref:CAAX prenyl protease 2/Lysostaphin resistance protein A-like domain-containing protein n=1 Tax=Flavihumibacter petaseus NBRC 106054 TaxID=1220578 RepID=A0A0E9N5I0_9BACT|nr:CPBP family intramembrane glutamic endopeptidase [Flavihumibacter petaseus]GAO44600.1 hypothetical protein FPE01S_03_06380 [Flavihumibacter petaseus NBRC 106054]
MQAIFSYFQDFLQAIHRGFFICCTLLAAVLVFANYRWGIETRWISCIGPRPLRFFAFYALYLVSYGLPWLLFLTFFRKAENIPVTVLAVVILAPAIFALKVTAGGWQDLIRNAIGGDRGRYLAIVSDWPVRLIFTSCLIFIAYAFLSGFRGAAAGLGLTTDYFDWRPYAVLLLAMIPLVAFAATQSSFLQAYPKLRVLGFLAPSGPSALQQGVYELAYASDFLTIELFFRGFLIVMLCRIAGPVAVLPMAVFYCSIHFGKPMLECISSFFGGIILGVIACYSRSILGGIVVHIGLAWMMEAAALISSYFHTNK